MDHVNLPRTINKKTCDILWGIFMWEQSDWDASRVWINRDSCNIGDINQFFFSGKCNTYLLSSCNSRGRTTQRFCIVQNIDNFINKHNKLPVYFSRNIHYRFLGRLNSTATRIFVQQLVKVNNNKNVKALAMSGLPSHGPAMRKSFPWHHHEMSTGQAIQLL